MNNGLTSIINYINEESEQQIKGIRSEAEARVEAMKEENRRRIEEECGRIREKAISGEETILQRGSASAELRKKQMLLTARQELISDTISYCMERLIRLPKEEYFDILKKLFSENVHPGDIKLYLNSRDLERMDDGIKKELMDIAKKAGARLEISELPKDIRGGFIMDLGDIEENLSIEAIFSDHDDDIRDLLSGLLFS